MVSGKLYVCGTPIGNLEDASIRLLKTLRKVDIIACEDTRHTIKLLNRYKIKNKLVSYHEHSSKAKEDYILEELLSGKDVALVSDAGMPTISDPGEALVRKVINTGIEIEVIPGPSACTAALAISGLHSEAFIFAGFLPNRQARRREVLTQIQGESRTVIFYEAPHRLLQTLQDMEAIMGGERQIAIARELTKKHQEMQQGSAEELRQHYEENPPRGEICILIPAKDTIDDEVDMDQIVAETVDLINKGIDKKEALKIKAREYKVKKSDIYKYFIDED